MENHLLFSAFKGKHLHVGVAGSVAAYKLCDIVRAWGKAGLHCSATLTEGAQHFISPLTFQALGAMPVYSSLFDGEDIFAHLAPGQQAQACIIAPATADVLCRLAQGAASDMLSAQCLAFDGALVIAPAMNPRMWAHPATQANVATLQARGAHFVLPAEGSTACGETGQGKLADSREIYLAALRALAPQDMSGQKVLVTMGATREAWDGVRYWTNPSTGIMGASLAIAAYMRGATVHAVCGNAPWLPQDIIRHNVSSAQSMFAAADALWDDMDMGLFTAAVADFSPIPFGAEKFKKEGAEQGFSVQFRPNPDILRTLSLRRKPHQKVLGFAAETAQNLAACVHTKLERKKAHIIVGNRVNEAGSGFGAGTNSVLVADCTGREEQWPLQSKPDVAWGLCSWLLSL
ncbi:MAG: bifunctional phosphopantothenoylcysteine decarboxylase/phosphopantothenate--cysteine ligase CoaBC [Desulfovibrionaceae bacterium]|nr:bifunctional phosphopantothenoylcysteine decarboxylase/phosphopantothenate--cysteine ligase CoaBC [Desulfovibrionaceae bacterium]